MDKQSKILILLSTYNGDKFLRNQLDSILSQIDVDIFILIRDDGSTDHGATLRILQEYKNTYRDKIDIIIGENIGWKKSFLELIRIAELKYSTQYKFYAFSDQDDIWLPEKLSIGISRLNLLPRGANLYCSNLFYYKNDINYGLIRKNKVIPTFKSCLVRNYGYGCTMVFNRELLFLVARELPVISTAHDHWLYQVATLCGYVFIDEEAYILYRQHENNQIGSRTSWIDVWKRRIKDFRYYNLGHQREEQAKELLRLFDKDMQPLALEATKKIANYRKSFRKQIMLLFDKEYTLGRKANDRWLKLRILLRRL